MRLEMPDACGLSRDRGARKGLAASEDEQDRGVTLADRPIDLRAYLAELY